MKYQRCKQMSAEKRSGGAPERLFPRLSCVDWGVYGIEQRRRIRTVLEPKSEEMPETWVREKLGLEPDGQQTRVLSRETKRGILNCTRQWGKSTIAAAKAVHHAWTAAESLTVVVSPSARQSAEFVRKAMGFARRLGVKPRGDGDNEISMQFANGSRIVGLPGTEATIRGFSAVSLLLVDEASRVSDELYLAIRPMLAVSQGTLWLMSTPFGKRGFFYEAWTKGAGEWERVQVKAADCPRIPADFLEEERRTMGDRWFRQEYCCEFNDVTSGVFDADMVERAMSDDFGELDLEDTKFWPWGWRHAL